MKTDTPQQPWPGGNEQPGAPNPGDGAQHPTRRWITRGVSLCLVGVVIGVLVVALLWTRHSGPPAASSQQPTQTPTAAGSPQPTQPPTVQQPLDGLPVRFSDTANNTKLAVQTNMTDPDVGIFTFGIPSGDQYHGGQASDLQQVGDGETMFSLSYQGTVELVPPGLEAVPGTASVTIEASFDLVQGQATAEFTDKTTKQHFRLRTQLPGGQLQAVEKFNKALLAQDWATVYALTSKSVTDAITEDQFAQQIMQQEQSTGTITAISITSSPHTTIDLGSGLTGFTVDEQMTVTLNGASKAESFTNLFILEDGVWKFLSS
jgi:hypothetical protein